MEQPTPTIEFHLTAHDDEHVAVYSGTSAQQASTEVVDGVTGLLRELPRGWLLYLHGVEPLAHPRWRELVDTAVTAGHGLALDSRGTLPLSRYAALGEAAGPALRRLLVRLNLIEVGRFSDFIERVVAIRGRLQEHAEVIVTAPLLEETFADLRRFESLCDEAEVPFRYELLVEGGNLARYSPEVERHIRGRVLHDAGDLRVIRPLVYVRETQTAAYAASAALPIIPDSCPACFTAPTQRAHMKTLLAREEQEHPHLFANLLHAMRPLMGDPH